MAKVYLISPARLKSETAIHGNVDERVLKSSITKVQDMRLELILGTKLIAKLKALVTEEVDNPGNVTGIEHASQAVYKTLLNDHCESVIINYAVADCIPHISYKLSNKGVTLGESENNTQTGTREREGLMANYLSSGDHYSDRLIRFLCANQTDYPEYTAGTDDVSQYRPQSEESLDAGWEF